MDELENVKPKFAFEEIERTRYSEVGYEFSPLARQEGRESHSPSPDFLDIPNAGGSRLQPRQLLQSDSGSLLKLHRESSSKRSESSKEKRSFSSHSIRCPPAGPAASSATIPGSAAALAAPAFLEPAPPGPPPPPPPSPSPSPPPPPPPPPPPTPPAGPLLPLPVLPPVRPPPPPPPPPLPEDRARLPASFNCRANQHTRNYERVPDYYPPLCQPRRVSPARSRSDVASTGPSAPRTCNRERASHY
ncbi:PREDICTED: WAS/WASL-interacting protein family member 3-like [Vollenhovia emeryi]|uniref:WAS/WASL-interacting protein family member 3-like n=1 Tax=Vollenhovia emeryi TaxID=411798 RepID=UPI0005F38956|nr:PREDICTED: WAS/WASL-interacting protein family member 3-like [Vollenhovia emeryi]